MTEIRIRDGFQGQKQWVLPKAMPAQGVAHPILQSLIPTDIGWYPAAQYHYREREQGASEHILIFCVDGEGWCEIGGQRRIIQRHDAVLIPRGVPHIYGASATTPWTIQWVHFTGKDADFFIYYLPVGENTLAVDPECARGIEQLFNECYDSFVGGFVLHRLVYCAQILHHLLGRLFFDNSYFSPVQRTSRFRSVESTITYLQQNVQQSVTLSEMAEHAGLSGSHFSFVFKQQTGYAPMDYFIRLKMQHASALLSLTSKTVHEIAYEIGYEDPYYFSRIFKKVMGVSPRRYRESPSG